MKRRKFLNISKTAAAGTFMLNGLSVSSLSASPLLRPFLINPSLVEDRILVMIQLHGGNDGLNAMLPIAQYADYQAARPNIGIVDTGDRSFINLDTTVSSDEQMGIHPDLQSFKSLYDDDKMAVIHSVGYNNHNQSHFRSRDVWWMGGNYDEIKGSGWMGRYLDHEYPNYPAIYPSAAMPDPIGLEIGTTVALGFHRENGIPIALASNEPETFGDLVGGIGTPSLHSFPDNHYGGRLDYMNEIFGNAGDYAAQLQMRYSSGSNAVTYPGPGYMEYPHAAPANQLVNKLAWQLQTVARLINGGCKSKIYLVKHTGFDTHDFQVDINDLSAGRHGALMYHLGTAVKAFQDDLAATGNDNKVLTLTFSEFGRRVAENGSFGTDHGTAAPMFAFGPAVKGGIIGTPPNLTDLDNKGNLLIQHDYRQVFTTALQDWLGADDDAIAAAEFTPYVAQKVDLIETPFLPGNTTLPVDLISLNAYRQGYHNVIEWKTANEIGLSHFELEKSQDGNRFESLTIVEASNTAEHKYNVVDREAFEGFTYYRLKSVDLDGSTKVSSIVSVFADRSFNVSIFPNPINQYCTIEMEFASISQYINVRLYDVQGRLIHSQQRHSLEFNDDNVFYFDQVSSGHYSIQISNGENILYVGPLIKL